MPSVKRECRLVERSERPGGELVKHYRTNCFSVRLEYSHSLTLNTQQYYDAWEKETFLVVAFHDCVQDAGESVNRTLIKRHFI